MRCAKTRPGDGTHDCPILVSRTTLKRIKVCRRVVAYDLSLKSVHEKELARLLETDKPLSQTRDLSQFLLKDLVVKKTRKSMLPSPRDHIERDRIIFVFFQDMRLHYDHTG